MTITPFETNLYQHLAPFFAEHGFTLLPEKKQFRRINTSGFQNIILSSVFCVDDTMLDVNFGARNDQIEQIAQQFLNNQPDFRLDANTFLLSVARFSGFKSSRYKIHSGEALSDVCEKIELFFNKQGFDFLDSASILSTLDLLLNESPNQPCQFVYNQTHRCYKGLIAARLNHNPHFEGLVDSYRHLLIRLTQNPYEQLHFERLIAYLQHYSAN
ncbi:hypothetical protein GCM10028808_49070 [Spirosoma migulaei]